MLKILISAILINFVGSKFVLVETNSDGHDYKDIYNRNNHKACPHKIGHNCDENKPEPICGMDGRTYINPCHLECSRVEANCATSIHYCSRIRQIK